MRTLRLVAATVAVLALISIAPLTAAPAAAAEHSAIVPAADPAPDPSGWKKWMLAVKSSLLGPAVNFAWQAEQLASTVIYADTYSTLNAQLGIDGIHLNSAGQIVGFKYTDRGTGTYTDVVVGGLEEKYREQAIANGKRNTPFVPPSTKAVKFAKIFGGVTGAFAAYDIGASLVGAPLGQFAGGFFGFDPNGMVCAQSEFGEGLIGEIRKWGFRSMSGQDCTQWDIDESYALNQDAAPNYSTVEAGGGSIRYTGTYHTSGTPSYTYHCYAASGFTSFSGELNTGTTGLVGTMHYPGFPSGTFTPLYGGFSNTSGINPSTACGDRAISTRYWANAPTENPALVIRTGTPGNYTIAAMTVTAGDPDRRLECDVEYTDGSHDSELGEIFKESTGVMGAPLCPGTPAGKTPETVTITDTQVGDPSKDQEISEQPVTPEFQEWWEDYPECQTGGCKLDLYRKVPTPIVSCFEITDGCPDWFEDPNKLDNYECRYGIHVEDLSECNVYAGLFQPGRVTSGAPYADPTTGEWSGGQNAPREADNAMTRPIQNPATARACNFPNAFLNPVGAAIAGGQCLFEWAAIPRPVVADVAFNSIADVWADKPPGAIVEAVEQVAMTGGATGCSISSTYKGTTAPLLDACGGIMGGFATFSRLATTALMAVAVFMQVRRQIAGMVNYNIGQD